MASVVKPSTPVKNFRSLLARADATDIVAIGLLGLATVIEESPSVHLAYSHAATGIGLGLLILRRNVLSARGIGQAHFLLLLSVIVAHVVLPLESPMIAILLGITALFVVVHQRAALGPPPRVIPPRVRRPLR
jgi:hypothetical protein